MYSSDEEVGAVKTSRSPYARLKAEGPIARDTEGKPSVLQALHEQNETIKGLQSVISELALSLAPIMTMEAGKDEAKDPLEARTSLYSTVCNHNVRLRMAIRTVQEMARNLQL